MSKLEFESLKVANFILDWNITEIEKSGIDYTKWTKEILLHNCLAYLQAQLVNGTWSCVEAQNNPELIKELLQKLLS